MQVSGRSGKERQRRLLWSAAVALACFLALAIDGARHPFSDVDHTTHALVQAGRDQVLQHSMRLVSRLGENEGLIPLIVVGSTFLWWRSGRRWALGLPVLMTGAGGLQFLAKWAVDRPRPNLAPWGFPSGHVLSLVVFFGLLSYLVATSHARRRWRWPAITACAAPVFVVGFSRLYLDMHWLTDVVGGFAIGVAYLLVAIVAVELISERRVSGLAGAIAPPVAD